MTRPFPVQAAHGSAHHTALRVHRKHALAALHRILLQGVNEVRIVTLIGVVTVHCCHCHNVCAWEKRSGRVKYLPFRASHSKIQGDFQAP